MASSPTPVLRLREPTGQPAYPLILVEGGAKWGKTTTALALSASPRVGQTFVFEFGDAGGGSADEYRDLGPFKIVETRGTWADFEGQLDAAMAVPMDDDRPNVIVVDSGTTLWEDLSWWAERRARNSRRGRDILAADPDAEVEVTSAYWNDAKARWQRMIRKLVGWPGIAVITASGEDVTAFTESGAIIPGRTMYRVAAERTTVAKVTAVVRMVDVACPVLVSVRSAVIGVLPPGGLALPADATLDHLIFDLMLGDDRRFAVPHLATTRALPKIEAMRMVLARLTEQGIAEGLAKEIAHTAWHEEDRGDEIAEATVDEVVTRALEVLHTAAPPPDTTDDQPLDGQATLDDSDEGDDPDDEGDDGTGYG